jgi:hypothetical protein
MRRLDGRTRNLMGNKCLLGSKCPASNCDRPRRKHPWGSVGGWNFSRDKPLDTQPPPSKQPVLLTDRNGMDQGFRTRSRLQLRAVGVYHRERIWFSSTLSCIGEAEKITKPLVGSSAHFNHQTSRGLFSPFQSPNLSWAFQLFQSTNLSWAFQPFQSPNLSWALQPISINQATLDNAWPGTCFLYLPQQLTPPSSSTPKDKWTHIPLHPL